jgi:hypothetical protein
VQKFHLEALLLRIDGGQHISDDFQLFMDGLVLGGSRI